MGKITPTLPAIDFDENDIKYVGRQLQGILRQRTYSEIDRKTVLINIMRRLMDGMTCRSDYASRQTCARRAAAMASILAHHDWEQTYR